MAKDPAVLFYTSDFLSGVADLTMEERGQYITLLCIQHQKGELTEKTIRLTVGSASDDLLSKFERLPNGNFINRRMEAESLKRTAYTESRRINGKLGGRPPKGGDKPKSKVAVKGLEAEWVEMLEFFDYTCLHCGVKFDKTHDSPTKDHIVPQSCGGETMISNLQPLCRECNSSKSADHPTDYRKRFIDDIPARLKTIWFSTNNHMENENENKDVNEVELPWSSESFVAAWQQWKDYKRTEHRFSFKSPATEQVSLNKLAKDAGSEETAIAMIENAIAMNWKGLFPIDTPKADKWAEARAKLVKA